MALWARGKILSTKINKLGGKWRWRLAKILALGLGIALGLGVLVVGLGFSLIDQNLPHLAKISDYHPKESTRVYAKNGELIGELGQWSRQVAAPDQIPDLVGQAFIASEDQNFLRHHGIDFLGIAQALWQTLTGQRETLRGASTITQQLAKSLMITVDGYQKATERSLARKVKEAILAVKLENSLTKPEILWIYLNEVYLGNGSYGVQAAAQNYFRKSLSQLTIGEIAMLAGLPQAPSRYSPQSNMPAALKRQHYVLGRMLSDGYITDEQHAQAMRENSQIVAYERENSFRRVAPYFLEHIRQSLIAQYGEEKVYGEGLKVFTTLDMDRQNAMQEAVWRQVGIIDKRQGFMGPLFRPELRPISEVEAVVKRINDEDLLALPPGHYLATVEQIAISQHCVRISLGTTAGVIPLSLMRWARFPDPSVNAERALLSRVESSPLKVGDVILVQKQEGEAHGMPIFSLETEPKIESAMVAIEPDSGYVEALVGGYSFDKSEYNRVFQACRQPGSAFKPIVYSAAIALKNYTPATMLMDAPLTFRDTQNESSWKPKNFGHNYRGEVTLREALTQSMNVPTINLMADVGIHNVTDWAKSLGITSPIKLELGSAIGSSCLSMWELSQAFLHMPNRGLKIEPMMVREITDHNHQRLFTKFYESDPWARRPDRMAALIKRQAAPPPKVMSEETAYTMHYLLREAARTGTAAGTNVLHRKVAGKTGTTNDSFDVWFAGYVKQLLAIAWVGNDLMDTPLGIYEQGGKTALPLFNDFMSIALQGVPDEDVPLPASMCEVRIDASTGLSLAEDHPLSFVAPFKCGEEPALKGSLSSSQTLEQALEILQ
jgi:penicillin-binding protein 1A